MHSWAFRVVSQSISQKVCFERHFCAADPLPEAQYPQDQHCLVKVGAEIDPQKYMIESLIAWSPDHSLDHISGPPPPPEIHSRVSPVRQRNPRTTPTKLTSNIASAKLGDGAYFAFFS